MGSFGLVELQGAGERVEDAGRGAGDLAALELGVVLDAEPSDCGDLAAPESGDAARPRGREADLVGGETGAASGEELAHLGTVVHLSSLGRAGHQGRAMRGALSVHPSTVTSCGLEQRVHSMESAQ